MLAIIPRTDRHPSRSCLKLLGIVCLLTMVGCGDKDGPIPIRGKVTYNGQPLSDGEIRYVPRDDAGGRMARGKLDAEGNFQLTTFDKADGALAGSYRVAVIAYVPGSGGPKNRETEMNQAEEKPRRRRDRSGLSYLPDLSIPEHYSDPEQSGLTDNVDANHTGYVEFELTD